MFGLGCEAIFRFEARRTETVIVRIWPTRSDVISDPSFGWRLIENALAAVGRNPRYGYSPDENIKVRIEENVREQNMFVVQTACPLLSEHILDAS